MWGCSQSSQSQKLDWCVPGVVTCDHHQTSSSNQVLLNIHSSSGTVCPPCSPVTAWCFTSPHRVFQLPECSPVPLQPHSQPLLCSAARLPPQFAGTFWPRSPISSPASLPGVGNPGVLHRLDVAAAANITVKNGSEGYNNSSLLRFSASNCQNHLQKRSQSHQWSNQS